MGETDSSVYRFIRFPENSRKSCAISRVYPIVQFLYSLNKRRFSFFSFFFPRTGFNLWGEAISGLLSSKHIPITSDGFFIFLSNDKGSPFDSMTYRSLDNRRALCSLGGCWNARSLAWNAIARSLSALVLSWFCLVSISTGSDMESEVDRVDPRCEIAHIFSYPTTRRFPSVFQIALLSSFSLPCKRYKLSNNETNTWKKKDAVTLE